MKRIIFLTMLVLSCSYQAYGFGSIPDGWIDGEPKTPPVIEPEPPPVTPPPPVQTTTTEHGLRAVYSTETNWHFSKPIAAYGTFDLFIGGKKYTVSMAYKDSQVEVRNSETRKNMVVIAPASFRDKTAYVSYPSGGTPTEPPVTPPPADEGSVPITKKYNHVNNWAFDGKGVAINLCKDAPGARSVTLNGVKMRLHVGKGQGNCNREIWTNVDFIHKSPTKVNGEIIIEFHDGAKGKVLIDGSRPYWHQNKGECFINCG